MKATDLINLAASALNIEGTCIEFMGKMKPYAVFHDYRIRKTTYDLIHNVTAYSFNAREGLKEVPQIITGNNTYGYYPSEYLANVDPGAIFFVIKEELIHFDCNAMFQNELKYTLYTK